MGEQVTNRNGSIHHGVRVHIPVTSLASSTTIAHRTWRSCYGLISQTWSEFEHQINHLWGQSGMSISRKFGSALPRWHQDLSLSLSITTGFANIYNLVRLILWRNNLRSNLQTSWLNLCLPQPSFTCKSNFWDGKTTIKPFLIFSKSGGVWACQTHRCLYDRDDVCMVYSILVPPFTNCFNLHFEHFDFSKFVPSIVHCTIVASLLYVFSLTIILITTTQTCFSLVCLYISTMMFYSSFLHFTRSVSPDSFVPSNFNSSTCHFITRTTWHHPSYKYSIPCISTRYYLQYIYESTISTVHYLPYITLPSNTSV